MHFYNARQTEHPHLFFHIFPSEILVPKLYHTTVSQIFKILSLHILSLSLSTYICVEREGGKERESVVVLSYCLYKIIYKQK